MPRLRTRPIKPIRARATVPEARRSLTAAGILLDPDNLEMAANLSRNAKRSKQLLAWMYYGVLGELWYPANFTANSLSKVHLFIGRRPAPEVTPIPVPEDESPETKKAYAALAALRGRLGGLPEIVRTIALNFFVSGECYLIGFKYQGQEYFEVRSVREVEVSPNQFRILDPVTGVWQERRKDEDGFQISRIWTPDPSNAWDADCSVLSALESFEELYYAQRMIKAALKNRIALGKILITASQISWGSEDPTESSTDEEGAAPKDPFLEQFIRHMNAPLLADGSASEFSPLHMQIDEQYVERGKGWEIIDTAPDISQQLIDRRNDAVLAIARSLNLPVETVRGMDETTFANATEIVVDRWRAHLEPTMIGVVDNLTRVHLWPALGKKNGSELVVWYDASHIISDPRRQESMEKAFENMAISFSAYRREKGIPETDAPDKEEIALRVMLKARVPPAFAETLLPQVLPVEPLPPTRKTLPAGQPEEAEVVEEEEEPKPKPKPRAQTAAVSPLASLGDRLAAIDRDLGTRLHGAAEIALSRSLEKATSRLVTKAKSMKQRVGDQSWDQLIRSVGKEKAIAIGGRELVAALGATDDDLLKEAFDPFRAQVDTWTTGSQRAALTLIPLPPAHRATAESQQDRDRSEALDWFISALVALAASRLYAPDVTPPSDGEHDFSSTVPYGLIREYMGRAGGGIGEHIGGVAVGKRTLELLSQRAITPVRWKWDYGISQRRTFHPHLQLDGVGFSTFTDPVLSNVTGFPGESFYRPGDHVGCRCIAIPVFDG